MNLLEDVKRILDKDEEVVKHYRPNKKRFVLLNSIALSFFTLLIGGGLLLFGILGATGVLIITNEDGTRDLMTPFVLIGVGCLPLLIALLGVIGNIVRYTKTVYVVTNKRLVVRSGFIGADYQSIRLQDVGMLNVRVDFLDKLVKPNSGSIIFASAATPMYDNRNRGNGQFAFLHIDNPYEVYQEVKEYIDSNK